MEYVDGFNISDIEDTDKNKFMDIMGHAMIHSLVVHGFFIVMYTQVILYL